MKNLKKIAITLLVLFMMIPSFAFANSSEETPELKSKIENIVKTMPEDEAIQEIEKLVGLDESSMIKVRRPRSVNNFAIYKKDGKTTSKSERAFKSSSEIVVKDDGYVYITLITQPMHYLKHNADVTNVIVMGNNQEYVGKNSDFRDASTKKKTAQVPGKIEIKVPVSEIKEGNDNFNSMLDVRFETNLRDDFSVLGKLFPNAMINPQAKIYFHK